MRKILLAAGVVAIAVFLLLYPDRCLESAKKGLDLWFAVVLPSLLPFMAASSILLETGVVRLISYALSPLTRLLFSAPGESAYVFLAAALSGYPVGARITGELYAKGQLSEPDAQAIVRFTSVTGPVFIGGAVATGMLGSPEAGPYLISSHYLSAVLTGVLFGIFLRNKSAPAKKETFKEACALFKRDISLCRPLGELLSESIEKALTTLVKIGGFIIVFSVIMEILSISGLVSAMAWVYSPLSRLTGLTEQSTKAMLLGGIEMTNGCSIASALDLSLPLKLPIISSIITFGGMCIHMQTVSVCAPYGLVPKQFALAKGIQASISYALCALFLSLFPFADAQPEAADIKTAAFFGIGYAAFSIITLLIIKYIQKTGKSAWLSFGRKL
jgi:sporulation integral membrane protein YlbJ